MLGQRSKSASIYHSTVQNQQLELGICPIAIGFPRERTAMCPLWGPVQPSKNIEGGRTSRGRQLKVFRRFKQSSRSFRKFKKLSS